MSRMQAPVLTGRLRLKDETAGTLRSISGRISSAFASIARTAAGFLTRDLVRGLYRATMEGMKLAATAETLQAAFTRMATAAGVEDMTLDKLRSAVQGTVGDVGLLTAANNAMALGLPVGRLNDLFRAARIVGNAMGRTTLEAVNDLTTGIGRQSRLILDNLGIIVDTNAAYEEFANRIGTTVAQMTDAERKAAFMGAAIEALEHKALILEGTTSETQTAFEQWGASLENLKRRLGEAFLPIAIQVTNGLTGILDTLDASMAEIKEGDWAGAFQVIQDAAAEKLAGLKINFEGIDWEAIWTGIRTWWEEVDWGELFPNLISVLENFWEDVISPSLGEAATMATNFLNWFSEINWATVFQDLSLFMEGFWDWLFQKAGDISKAFTDWFGTIKWPEVFASIGEFGTSLTHWFYEQIASVQDRLFEAFWKGILGEGFYNMLFEGGGASFPGFGAGGGEAGKPDIKVPSRAPVEWGGTSSGVTFVFQIDTLIGNEENARQIGEKAAEYALNKLSRMGNWP